MCFVYFHRKTETFWITTGLFPQEFIIRFPDNMKILTVSIHSYNSKYINKQLTYGMLSNVMLCNIVYLISVKRLRIEKSTSDDADNFEEVADTGILKPLVLFCHPLTFLFI